MAPAGSLPHSQESTSCPYSGDYSPLTIAFPPHSAYYLYRQHSGINKLSKEQEYSEKHMDEEM
jgi:hypothetical protein